MKESSAATDMRSQPFEAGAMLLNRLADPRGWAILALFALGVVALWDVWADIVRQGLNNESMSHMLLAPIMALILFWVRRHRLRGCRPIGYWVGIVLILAGLGLYLGNYAFKAGIQTLWYSSVVFVVAGTMVVALGRDFLTKFLPAILVLMFVIPVPATAYQMIAQPLQTVSAFVAADVLSFLGADVVRAGNLLTVNGNNVNVAEACSGLRTTFALFMVVYVYVFCYPVCWWARVILILLAPVIAIASNILRVIPTAYAYGYLDSTWADPMHDLLGWASLLIAWGICMAFEAVLAWAHVSIFTGSWDDEDIRIANPATAGQGRSWVSIGAASIALLSFTAGVYAMRITDESIAYHARVRAAVNGMELSFDRWAGQRTELLAKAEEVLQPNAVFSARFRDPLSDQAFQVSLIQTGRVRDMGHHTPRVCYVNQGWKIKDKRPVAWTIGERKAHGIEFVFRQYFDQGIQQIAVGNFYVMPNGEFMVDADDALNSANTPTRDSYGAAQFQFIFFDPRMSAQQRHEIVESFLNHYKHVIEAILDGYDA